MIKAFFNYCIKVFLNLGVACLVAGGCAYLCTYFMPYSEVISILSVDIPNDLIYGTEFLKKIPYVGDMIGFAIDVVGIPSTPEFGDGVNLLSTITFGLLMICTYKLTEMFYSAIKKIADTAMPTAPFYRIFNDVISFAMMVYTTVITSTLLNALLIRNMQIRGYGYWAVLLGLILVLVAMLAIKYKSSASLLKFLFEFLLSAFTALLIYFMSIILSIMANMQSISVLETSATTVGAICAIMLLTFLFAYFLTTTVTNIIKKTSK